MIDTSFAAQVNQVAGTGATANGDNAPSAELWSNALEQAAYNVPPSPSPAVSQGAVPEQQRGSSRTGQVVADKNGATDDGRSKTETAAASIGEGTTSSKIRGKAAEGQASGNMMTTSHLIKKHSHTPQAPTANSSHPIPDILPALSPSAQSAQVAVPIHKGSSLGQVRPGQAAASEVVNEPTVSFPSEANSSVATMDTASDPVEAGSEKTVTAKTVITSTEIKTKDVSASEFKATLSPLSASETPTVLTTDGPAAVVSATTQSVISPHDNNHQGQAGITPGATKPLSSDNTKSLASAELNNLVMGSAEPATSNDKIVLGTHASSDGAGGIIADVGAASAATANASPTIVAPASTAATFSNADGSVAATPAALAATISAMHQNGQSNVVLRLDPPGLGALSIHIALGHNSEVNVQFIPTITQTAQLLNSGLDDLRQAMANAGLALGQAQVGGGGQGAGSPSNGQGRGARSQAQTGPIVPSTSPPDQTGVVGVRAYA